MTIPSFACGMLFLTALVAGSVALAQSPASDGSSEVKRVLELNRQAVKLLHEGRYAEGVAVAQEAVQLSESKLGPEHPDTALSLNNLATLYESMGAYDKALPLYQRALAIREKALGPEHPDTAASLNNLASLYQNVGAYEKALPLYQRALAINEKALGPEHPDTAASLNNLAALYQSMGAYDQALPLHQRSLAIREKALGPEHPRTANSLNNLALVYKLMGAYDQALPLYQRALAIREKALGPEHPNTAASLNNLAALYKSMGAYDKALPLYQRALAIKEKARGPEHPDTALSLNNLAGLYKVMGAHDQALPLYQRALAISEQTLGPEHPDTATSVNNLAELYRTMGRYDAALPLYQRALAINEKALGPEHPDTAATLNNLALLYQSMGRYDAALPLYQRSLAINDKALGPEHPDTALSLNNLASLYQNMGAYEKALPLYQRALAINEKALGPEHPNTATSLNELAELHRSMGATDKALPLHQRALAINEKVLGPEHPDMAISLNNLALVYKSMGAHDQALPLHQRSLAIREKALGPEHPRTANSLNNLALVYQSMGAYDQALPLLQQALPIALGRMRMGADPELLRNVAGNLCRLSAAASPPRTEEAIFYCKLAVNAGQFQRAGAKGLDRALRASLTQRIEDPYHNLAKLLAESGRVAEAEQVLLALKDAEYADFVRGPPEGGAAPVALTPEEKRLADEINALAESLGKVYAELDAHRRKAAVLTPEAFTQREEHRGRLQQQLLAKLGEISARLKPKDNETATAVAPQDTRLTRLVSKLTGSTYGESSVVVMYVPEERVTTVLVTGPSGPAALQLPVGSSTLNPQIDSLRLAIREKKDYRPHAQALHRHLIAPVQAHLGTRKLEPKTLMLYLTGRLRYLPFATLIDDSGNHLIQKYRLAVLTAAARDKADADPIGRWTITAFGSTKPAAGLSALPAVRDELDGIVRSASNTKGTLPGQSLLDEQFTRAAWQRMLNAGEGARSSVVHVATHFQSQPGDWNRSFLLLGTGERYEISELDQGLSTNLDEVDLITLSACATELTDQADGKEFEGLGAVFQKNGARAVIGTLWPVQDAGSAALMKAFYAARGEQRQMSKAAALQDAQVQLLTGKIKSSNPSIDLTHPYYWAPFILMGNWL